MSKKAKKIVAGTIGFLALVALAVVLTLVIPYYQRGKLYAVTQAEATAAVMSAEAALETAGDAFGGCSSQYAAAHNSLQELQMTYLYYYDIIPPAYRTVIESDIYEALAAENDASVAHTAAGITYTNDAMPDYEFANKQLSAAFWDSAFNAASLSIGASASVVSNSDEVFASVASMNSYIEDAWSKILVSIGETL